MYKSVAQKNAGLMSNGTIDYIIGTVLGGGSAVNGMVYNRGSPFDYDNWANLTNDPTWSYANLLKYFKRIEDYQGNFESEEHHGKGGPIPITAYEYAPGLEEFLEAGKSLGYQVGDPNGPQKIGFAPMEFSRKRGKRMSAFKGYIQPYLQSRPHLKILQNSPVIKILFDADKAVGVQYKNAKTQQIFNTFAQKEIIVSAGAMDSPVILMRSGIGPQDVLTRARITPLKYLPVGKNLQDHYLIKMDFTVTQDLATVHLPERDLTPESLQTFEDTGDGPYSSLNGIHVQAFLVSSKRTAEGQGEWPDIHFMHIQSPAKMNVVPEKDEDVENEDDPGQVGVSTMVVFTRPKSSGSLVLNTDNFQGVPLIDFQFLTDPHDMEVMVEGIQMFLKMVEETPSFQKQGARYSTKPLEPCKGHAFRSEDYWRCFVKYTGGSGIHAGGTCKMGRRDDPSAVVDSNLKVIGVKGLRVIDLSVTPNVTNANTQAVAYVIAEKASEQILGEWKHLSGGNLRREKEEL